jgi:hypothetical protein
VYPIAFITLEKTVRIKSKYLGISLGLLIIAALTPWTAKADWLNLTGAETAPNIAEIYVQDDSVRLVLEVYVGDLDSFSALVPDEWLRDQGADRPASWNWPSHGCASIASRPMPA